MPDLDLLTWLGAIGIALAAGCASGLSGFGAGLMMSAFLVPVLGAKSAVAVLAVTMVATNIGRAFAFATTPSWRSAALVLTGALPAMVPGAWLLAGMSEALAALVVGIVLLASLIWRRLLKGRSLKLGAGPLVAGGAVVGLLSGLSTGGGVLIIPLLLGAGLHSAELIVTDAVISLALHVARVAAYGRLELLDAPGLVLGLILGLATVPGSWLAAMLVRRTGAHVHALALELLVACVGFLIVVQAVAELMAP
jgi:uncharacterized membrane protein YfcA